MVMNLHSIINVQIRFADVQVINLWVRLDISIRNILILLIKTVPLGNQIRVAWETRLQIKVGCTVKNTAL